MNKVILALILMLGLSLSMVGLTEAEAASSGQILIVNKTTNKLAFFDNGKLVKTFPVATGKTTELTPEGRFPIVNRIKNRPYYTDKIPGGDPRNPLGDRWLGLNARGTNGTTYAIHGNSNPNSIGKYVSAGCVRMYNDDIRWLFDQIRIGTDVVIVQSAKTMEQIAAANGYQTQAPIKVFIDGQTMSVTNAPFMENNRILVPMRSVFTGLGATVSWDNKTKTISAYKNGTKIQLTINSKRAFINGVPHTLDVAPTIKSQQTFVPTRFVSEALGAGVKWDGKKRTVSIISPSKPKPEPAPVVPPEPVKTPINVVVNGTPVDGDAFILEGVSMVPIRTIFEWLNVPFEYDQATSSVSASNGRQSIVATNGKKVATINGVQQTMTAAPLIDGGRMYVPVRAVTETFSGASTWDGTSLHITVK